MLRAFQKTIRLMKPHANRACLHTRSTVTPLITKKTPSLLQGNPDPTKGSCGIAVLLRKSADHPFKQELIEKALTDVSTRGSTSISNEGKLDGDGIGIAMFIKKKELANLYGIEENQFQNKGFSLQCNVPNGEEIDLDKIATYFQEKIPNLEFHHNMSHETDFSSLTESAQEKLGQRIDLVFSHKQKNDPKFINTLNTLIALFNITNKIQIIGSGDQYLILKSFAHAPYNGQSILDQFPITRNLLKHTTQLFSQTRKATGSNVQLGSIQPFGLFNTIFLVNGEMNNKRKLILPLCQFLDIKPTKENKNKLLQLSDTALQSLYFQLSKSSPETMIYQWHDYYENKGERGPILQQGPLTYVYATPNSVLVGRDANGGRPGYLSQNEAYIGMGSVAMPLKDSTHIPIRPGQSIKIDGDRISTHRSTKENKTLHWILPDGQTLSTEDAKLPMFMQLLDFQPNKQIPEIYETMKQYIPDDPITAMGYQGADPPLLLNVAGVTNEAYDPILHPICTRATISSNKHGKTYSPSPFITQDQLSTLTKDPSAHEINMLMTTEISDTSIEKFIDSTVAELRLKLDKESPSTIILNYLPTSKETIPLSPLPLGVAKIFEITESNGIPIILKAIPTGIEIDPLNETLFAMHAGAQAIYNPTIQTKEKLNQLHDRLQSSLGRIGIPIFEQLVGSSGFVATNQKLSELMTIPYQQGIQSDDELATSTRTMKYLLEGLAPDRGISDTSEQQLLTQADAIKAQKGRDGLDKVHKRLDIRDPLTKTFEFIKIYRKEDMSTAIIGGGAAALTAIEHVLESSKDSITILLRNPTDIGGSARYPAEDHYEIIEGFRRRFESVLTDPRVTVIQTEAEKLNETCQHFNTIIDTRYEDKKKPNTVQKFLDFARNGTTNKFFTEKLKTPRIYFTGGFGNVFDDVIKIFKKEESIISDEFYDWIGNFHALSLNALIRKSPEELIESTDKETIIKRINNLQEKFPEQFSWYAQEMPKDPELLACLGIENFKGPFDPTQTTSSGINLIFNSTGAYDENQVLTINGIQHPNDTGIPAYVQNIGSNHLEEITSSNFTKVIKHGWRKQTGSIADLGNQAQDIQVTTPEQLNHKKIPFSKNQNIKKHRQELLYQHDIKKLVQDRLKEDSFKRYQTRPIYKGRQTSIPEHPIQKTPEDTKPKQPKKIEATLLAQIETEKPKHPNHFAYISEMGELKWVPKEENKSIYYTLKQLGHIKTTSCDNTTLKGSPSCSECGGHVKEPVKLPRSAHPLKPKDAFDLHSTLACQTDSNKVQLFVHQHYKGEET